MLCGMKMSRQFKNHLILLAAGAILGCLLCPSLSSARDTAVSTVIPLHPAVGDTLSGAEAEIYGIFPDLDGMVAAVFRPAPWGGYLALITLRGPHGIVLRERNVPAADWREWRQRIAAGTAPADSVTMTNRPITSAGSTPAVWPEAPMPSRVMPPAPASPAAAIETGLSGRWLVKMDLGYKHSTTVFNDFFTDMMMLSATFGRSIGEHFMPWAAFQYSMGDLPDDFEDATGNGNSSLYAFEFGLETSASLGDRTDLYAGAGGGYYMRSLKWGGHVFLGYDGYYRSGTAVRELQDWGWNGRAGVRWNLKPQGGKIRLLDVGLRVESFGADSVLLDDPTDEVRILADDHDFWVGLSVGLVLGL